MGILARLLRWVWRRWADYNSLLALLDLLDWKTGLTAALAGAVSMFVFATRTDWSWQTVLLDALLAAGCFACVFIALRLFLGTRSDFRMQALPSITPSVAPEIQTEKSELALSLDEADHQAACFHFEDRAAEITFFVRVANTNGHHLKDCQIQLRYDSYSRPEPPEDAYFIVSKPFAMRPDEIKRANILYATRDSMQYPRKNLNVPALAQVNDIWQMAMAIPILVPGEIYNITVEAVSASTRKSTLKIIAVEESGHWVLKNASVSTHA
jgi:hypothetical protein